MSVRPPTGFSARVLGIPAPQGSKTLMPNRRMVESSKKVGPWRDAVATAAMVAHSGRPPLDGPLRLDAEFRIPMPQSRPKRVREFGAAWRTATPDLDKLLRSTCDGLTAAGVIVDDARIVSIAATKHEVTGWTGARLALRPLDPGDLFDGAAS